MMLKKAGLAGVLLASVVGFSLPAAAQEYYAGKTITFVLPGPPGGSTDANWRAVAPFLSKHTPGNPEIIIQNMDGGGGNTGRNYVYERVRPDGLTLGAQPWNPLGALTNEPGFRVDYTQMELIGGLPDPLVVYVRRDVVEGGLEDPKDILNARPFILAGQRPGSATDMMNRLTFELMGVDARYVPGYQGSTQRHAAILAGEADAQAIGVVAYKTTIEPTAAGEVVPLWRHALTPSEVDPDMLDFPTFYEAVKGEPPSGPQWELLQTVYLATSVFFQSLWAPPGTPEEAIEALRTGWGALMEDEDFQQEAIRLFGDRIPLVGWEEGREVVNAVLGDPDPEQIEALKAMMAEQ